MSNFLIRMSERKWYPIVLLIACIAFAMRAVGGYFPELLPSAVRAVPRDYFFLAFIVVAIPSYTVALKLVQKEGRGKYDPRSPRLRRLAAADAVIGILMIASALIWPFAWFYFSDSSIKLPSGVIVVPTILLCFLGVHLLFRAVLAPLGAYPWRWLPKKYRVVGSARFDA